MMKQSITIFMAAFVLLFAAPTNAIDFGSSGSSNTELVPRNVSVVDIIGNSDVHETLATAISAASLDDVLNGNGPFTVFAPNDDAFDMLPDGVLDDLLEDPEGFLTDILLNHVVMAEVFSDDLSDGQIVTTALGKQLTVSIVGDDVYLTGDWGNAWVIDPDLEATNGVVHVIATVMVPSPDVMLYTDSEYGVYMTDSEGFPLYFFSLDAFGESNCTGGCINVWPVFYEEALIVGEGLDPEDFDVIERPDGDMQTTYKGWPLYYYVNDPGIGSRGVRDQINGDGVNNVWFVAKPDYTIMLVNNQLVGLDGNNYTGDYELGEEVIQYFTDDAGVTLYTWINDNFNQNNFTNSDFSNNHIWPVYEEEEVVVPSILDASLFSVVDVFGTPQLAYKGWPLYYFGQDNGIRGNTLGVSVPAPGVWPVAVADQDDAPFATVVDIIVNSDVHETLATAVMAADLVDLLSSEGPFTVFAPTDFAFDQLPDGLLDDLLADPEGALTDVLFYHVVEAYALSTDLEDGQVITTVLGEDVVVTITADGVFINDAEVVVADLLAENGVVHVIDAVLVPSEDDVTDGELIHFFFFGGNLPNNTPLETIEPTFNQVEGALISFHSALEGYPFDPDHPNWRKASMERRNAATPLNYRPEGNDGLEYDESGIRGMQVRQPYVGDAGENTLFLHLPTTGYENVVLRFAAKDQGDDDDLMAVEELIIDYSIEVDGEWITTGLDNTVLELIHEEYQLFEVDFTGIPEVNDNENFVVRIRFDGPNLDLDEGDRVAFNNFSLDGSPVELPATVVDIIVNSDVHETLATAVMAADLVDLLSSEGPFTVFAPTDFAFDQLPDGLLDDLLADPEGALADVLFYHVVEAYALSTDLEDGQVITTALGEDVVVTITADGVFINDAEVVVADLLAENGVVHVIDAVLIPEEDDPVDAIDDFPFTENFEAEWVGEPLAPENWTVVNGAEGSYWERSSVQSNSGEFSARSYQGFASDNLADEWLITPALNLDNPDATQMLFYGYSNQEPDGVRENMRIMILDEFYDNTDDLHANATLIQVVPFTQDWDEYVIDLEQYSGVKYLAFNYYITEEDNATFNWIYVDDVIIGTFETFSLTMLSPEGEGSVTPAEGVYVYTEGTEVALLAEPSFGWEFSHWTGDVADPNSASTSILMDDDYTIQANFVPFDGIDLPWAEDFSGMQNGTVPANWARDVNNWGVFNSSNAGGEAPEMRFHWSPNIVGEFYLYSPKINTSGNDLLDLSFKNFVNNFTTPGSYTLRVVTIADGVEYLVEEWVDPDNIPAYLFEATLTAEDHGVGTDDFHIAWVFDGISNDINWWNFDDILLTVGEPQPDIARVQIIHNSADALVEEVDVFVNGDLFLEGVGFRQATPFIDVPAGVDLDLVIAPAGAGFENGVGPITVQFDAGETYVVVAAGNVSTEGYDPVEPFALYVYDMGQEEAQNPDNTDLLAFHGSTDAPTVSIWETTTVGGEIIGDFSFGDFAGYLPLIPGDYIIELRDASGEVTVAAYSAPLATLGLQGEAIVAVASGFLAPENNSDGPAFGLFVALATGGDLIELPLVDDATYTVMFNITNELGDPITDAIITLGDFVNEAGNYTFEDVPAGMHEYSVSAICYATVTGELLVDQDMTIDIILQLDILPGDANGDGVVDVLDAIAMRNYFVGLNPEPFCFHNADINNDGIINVLDIVGVVNIFAKGVMNPYFGLQSETANIYLTETGIMLDSDGTLAGIQFELSGNIPADIAMNLQIQGYELVYVYENGNVRGLIHSLDNRPIPSGMINLLTFDHRLNDVVWIDAIAGNINSDAVDLVTHQDDVTGINDSTEIDISVYPNPVSDILWVEFDNHGFETRISFVNVNGQVVRSMFVYDQGHTQVSFDISGLPAGVYMLRVDHKDSQVIERVILK